jgi:hypothetical protein
MAAPNASGDRDSVHGASAQAGWPPLRPGEGCAASPATRASREGRPIGCAFLTERDLSRVRPEARSESGVCHVVWAVTRRRTSRKFAAAAGAAGGKKRA